MPDSARETFLKYGAPWLLYGAGSWVGYPALGCLAAVGLLTLMLQRKPTRAKAVEWVLLGYFLLLLVGVFVLQSAWLIRCQGWLASGLLAAMAFGSLLVGAPFTLPFAREEAPRDMWHNPHFYRVNQILTVAWGLAFLICAMVKYGERLPSWAALLTNFVIMFLAVMFTKWFPQWYRREIYLKVSEVRQTEAPARG